MARNEVEMPIPLDPVTTLQAAAEVTTPQEEVHIAEGLRAASRMVPTLQLPAEGQLPPSTGDTQPATEVCTTRTLRNNTVPPHPHAQHPEKVAESFSFFHGAQCYAYGTVIAVPGQTVTWG